MTKAENNSSIQRCRSRFRKAYKFCRSCLWIWHFGLCRKPAEKRILERILKKDFQAMPKSEIDGFFSFEIENLLDEDVDWTTLHGQMLWSIYSLDASKVSKHAILMLIERIRVLKAEIEDHEVQMAKYLLG